MPLVEECSGDTPQGGANNNLRARDPAFASPPAPAPRAGNRHMSVVNQIALQIEHA